MLYFFLRFLLILGSSILGFLRHVDFPLLLFHLHNPLDLRPPPQGSNLQRMFQQGLQRLHESEDQNLPLLQLLVDLGAKLSWRVEKGSTWEKIQILTVLYISVLSNKEKIQIMILYYINFFFLQQKTSTTTTHDGARPHCQ